MQLDRQQVGCRLGLYLALFVGVMGCGRLICTAAVWSIQCVEDTVVKSFLVVPSKSLLVAPISLVGRGNMSFGCLLSPGRGHSMSRTSVDR